MDERAPEVRDREVAQAETLEARRWLRVHHDESVVFGMGLEQCLPSEPPQMPPQIGRASCRERV